MAFEIPAQLSVRQPRPGEPGKVETNAVDRCEFRAISWHQLLYKPTPFTVTAGLPATGSGPGGSSFPAAVLALLAAGAGLLGAGWALRVRVRPA